MYMLIAVLLAACTLSSFVFNMFVHSKAISPVSGFLLILAVAFVKVILVGWVFMHLKWDWRSLYFLIVPVAMLGVLMMIVIASDSYIGMSRDEMDAHIIAAELDQQYR
jgi:cytochrome c oxidase subunit IV